MQGNRVRALAQHAAALADRYDALASSVDLEEQRDRRERVARLRAVVQAADTLREDGQSH